MKPATDPQFQSEEATEFARAMRSIPVVARGGAVNRTHRVVRERAKVMQEKRERERSLMLPLLLCAALLLLTAVAVWSGVYQNQTADVAALATTQATNHFLVVMLWFVPVLLAVLATLWVRRSRANAKDEAL